MLIEQMSGRLIVYFDDPFWVGIFERVENGKLSVAKVTFGAEPKDYEIQEFISCIINHRFSSARLRRKESIAMADIMQQFAERKNFMEI